MGLKERIELGGQDCPSSTVGEILLWKKAQKNDTKKKISEAMNRIIPVFSPFITRSEWFPCVVPSRWISRHHMNPTKITMAKEKTDTKLFTLFTIIKPERTKHNAPFEAKRGQGLTSTRWKGLNFTII